MSEEPVYVAKPSAWSWNLPGLVLTLIFVPFLAIAIIAFIEVVTASAFLALPFLLAPVILTLGLTPRQYSIWREHFRVESRLYHWKLAFDSIRLIEPWNGWLFLGGFDLRTSMIGGIAIRHRRPWRDVAITPVNADEFIAQLTVALERHRIRQA
jgi:hypothetical protein